MIECYIVSYRIFIKKFKVFRSFTIDRMAVTVVNIPSGSIKMLEPGACYEYAMRKMKETHQCKSSQFDEQARRTYELML